LLRWLDFQEPSFPYAFRSLDQSLPEGSALGLEGSSVGSLLTGSEHGYGFVILYGPIESLKNREAGGFEHGGVGVDLKILDPSRFVG
jgi:hypothetical protein